VSIHISDLAPFSLPYVLQASEYNVPIIHLTTLKWNICCIILMMADGLCEERKRRSNLGGRGPRPRLLRFARNDRGAVFARLVPNEMRELDEAISLCVGLVHHGDIQWMTPLNLHLRIVGCAEGLTRAGSIMGVESILAGVGPSFSILVTK